MHDFIIEISFNFYLPLRLGSAMDGRIGKKERNAAPDPGKLKNCCLLILIKGPNKDPLNFKLYLVLSNTSRFFSHET